MQPFSSNSILTTTAPLSKFVILVSQEGHLMENFGPWGTITSYYIDSKETTNTEDNPQIILLPYCLEDLLDFRLLTLLFRSKHSPPSPHGSQLIYESYEDAVQLLLIITSTLQPRPYLILGRIDIWFQKCENCYDGHYDGYRKRIS